MAEVAALRALWREELIDWRTTRLADLLFRHQDAVWLALVILIALPLVALTVRTLGPRTPERSRVAVPAVLAWIRPGSFAALRHVPLLLFLLGLPFFILAFGDPYTKLTRETKSFPGRRIALVIDASSSMVVPFKGGTRLARNAPSEAAFFTTIGAAEAFVRLRMKGPYRDLIALVEFGDEAYVITPFTNDYGNILLTISLLNNMDEFMAFPEKGTVISLGIAQAIELFRAFDFLKASGNLMVIFSDGQDSQVAKEGTTVDRLLAGALDTRIPVYFIRTSYNREMGDLIPDALWKSAVEKTGGKFYAAADEATILRAIQEIDRRSTGRIEIKQYSTERPRFAPFAMMAAGLWAFALVSRLTVPWFRRFP